MRQRKMGDQGLVGSEMGLVCMGMSEFYGTARPRIRSNNGSVASPRSSRRKARAVPRRAVLSGQGGEMMESTEPLPESGGVTLSSFVPVTALILGSGVLEFAILWRR